ncbi:MAG: hypothetical protein CSB06_02820 [Bacteroidia bacterium]|nr:MAG: hypothetical protein CSB06_02820 [Bacteroidia bacterium]
MKISIIAAITQNNGIGKNNDLLCHLSEDLKRFKKLTMGKPVLMGRKTYESLPFQPLPGRENIIISHQKNLQFPGAKISNSLDEALALCKNAPEIFVCGGAQIYELFIPYADSLFLTKILQDFEADAFFPEINYQNWQQINKENKHDAKTGLDFIFEDYTRKPAN